MDFGHTYATPQGDRVMLYVPVEVTVPERIELELGGKPKTYSRVAPDSIKCGDVPDVSGVAFGRMVSSEVKRWRKVATEANVKLD